MNLGLLAKQDVVISGGFRIDESVASSPAILIDVAIFDVAQKKLVASFTERGPADSRIFDTVTRISDLIAEKAKSVLPNKDNWQQQRLSSSQNRVGAMAAMGVVSLPSAFSAVYTSEQELVPKDFSNSLLFMLEYQRFGIITDNIFIGAQGQFVTGSKQLSIADDPKPLSTSLNYGSGLITAGYELSFARDFSFLTLVGCGYSMGSIEMNYSTLTFLPVSNGSEVSSQTIDLSHGIVQLETRLGYSLTSSLKAYLGTIIQSALLKNNTNATLSISSGVSFSL